MQFKNGNSTIQLSDITGSLVSYVIDDKEFCAKSNADRALITLKLLDEKGNPYYYTSNEATDIVVRKEANGCTICYKNIHGVGIDCIATVRAYKEEGFSWRLSVNNKSGMTMEWVEFPQIKVENTLKGNGGKSQLFWPAVEGVLVEDAKIRDKSMMKYREITRKTGGYNGAYPGSAVMQFMAYYDDKSGLYFGAHDPACAPKVLEWYEKDDGIVLELRTFCNGAMEKYELNYDIIH